MRENALLTADDGRSKENQVIFIECLRIKRKGHTKEISDVMFRRMNPSVQNSYEGLFNN